MHNRLLLVVLLGLVPAAAGCDVQVGEKGVSVDIAHGKATDEWVRSYTIAPGGRLEIANLNGQIAVSAAAGNTVDVRATREARASSDDAARDLLQKMRIVENVSRDHVSIAVQADGDNGFRIGRGVTVRYEVRLPAGLSASFRTENGGVTLDNVNGRIEAATTNGGITGRDVAGSITASTVNGGVQMGLASVSGDVALSAVNGGVRLELPASLSATLDARTVNGSVSVDDAFALTEANRSRQHVAGKINNGGPKISAETTNGSVRVMVRART
jgi:hypothetical protein